MSTERTSVRIGFVCFVAVMIVWTIANAYAGHKRDKSLARLQVRIDALEARMNTITRRTVPTARAE
jgi:hypothetical protein